MNLAAWLKDARLKLGRSCVAVFGMAATGPIWGTGVLLDFRGIPLVLTCAHVIDPITGIAYVTTDRFTYQSGPVYDRRRSDSTLDWGILIVRDREQFGAKRFVAASEALLEPIAQEEPVLVYGFPLGHKLVQLGGEVDVAASTATFRSMTYLTVTGRSRQLNTQTGRHQPVLEWNTYGNREAKTFKHLGKDLTSLELGGFSGGPVFMCDARRVLGCVTHASPAWLWYNPIADILRALDSALS
jgi:hypothetical protein